jgi:uncharacterized protein YndB with AHSA1/START domain
MPSILHDFPIVASVEKVFSVLSTPAGLDQWWTLKSSGNPVLGAEYTLFFGPEYDWHAAVSKCTHNKEFEWTMTRCHDDWMGSRVGFTLEEKEGRTNVRFYHSGWKEANEHFRVSTYCWAMYLRIAKRYIEFGETVAYDKRLDV